MSGAETALREACASVGLRHDDAVMLRARTNVVFALPSARLVARVAPPGTTLSDATRVHDLVWWLNDTGLPVAPPWPGCRPPVLAAGRVVTLWVQVDAPEPLSYAALGHVLHEIHTAPSPPPQLHPPHLAPLTSCLVDLTALPHVPGIASWAPLRQRLRELTEAAGRLPCEAPLVLVHGDAHLGNLLVHQNRPVLGDWDRVSIGAPEWDLLPSAIDVDRRQRPPSDYAQFAAAYGRDVTAWYGYPVLREIHEWRTLIDRVALSRRYPQLASPIPVMAAALYRRTTTTPWPTTDHRQPRAVQSTPSPSHRSAP